MGFPIAVLSRQPRPSLHADSISEWIGQIASVTVKRRGKRPWLYCFMAAVILDSCEDRSINLLNIERTDAIVVAKLAFKVRDRPRILAAAVARHLCRHRCEVPSHLAMSIGDIEVRLSDRAEAYGRYLCRPHHAEDGRVAADKARRPVEQADLLRKGQLIADVVDAPFREIMV